MLQITSEMLLETHMAHAPSLQCALRLSHSTIVTALFDECGVPAEVCLTAVPFHDFKGRATMLAAYDTFVHLVSKCDA